MDSFSGRSSRQSVPQREPQPAAASHHAEAPAHRAPAPKRPATNKGLLWTIFSLVIVALLAWGAWQFFVGSSVAGVKGGQYQAVFLSNSQVYFGKLSTQGAGFYKLSDVFYLQASQQAATDAANPQKTSANSDVQLIKLGSEVHGPEDTMVIARDQVLFFENLKADGKVAKTIGDYKSKNK